MAPSPRPVTIVPHTHWDREWYAGFQTFRMRLLDVLDGLLPELESDPAYAHFLLDGQMAVVDDYLALRPEAEPALRRLAATGRLAMGPWYILMDEFLVSGETMVRDLQMGFERAAAFGGAMEVGYLPDMFGHVAQMPQILRQFGLGHAVVWRGVPAAVDRSGFWWEAPDGSVVRAEYLPEGYGNGAALPDDAKALVEQLDRFVESYGDMLVGPILWMQGTDHQEPRPWLGHVVAEANAIQDRYELRVASLADHVAGAPTDDLPTWRGELRSGARANLLMGVASNRVDVKQAAAAAERGLERRAEPLAALHLAHRWPEAPLAEAWKLVVQNCAHDSICACSIDDVCDAVLHRYAEAVQIADGVVDRAVTEIAAHAAPGPARAVVVNPSPRPRCGVVEVRIPGEGEIEGMQLLRTSPGDTATEGIPRSMALVMTRQLLDMWKDIASAEVDVDDDGVLTITIVRDPDLPLRPHPGPLYAEVKAHADADPDGPARVVLRRQPLRTFLARVADLPAVGWRTFAPAPLDVEPVRVDELDDAVVLANGCLTVRIPTTGPACGTFEVDGTTGLGRLVDDGDVGDTYNWCPPADDVVVDAPTEAEVVVARRGPVSATVTITGAHVLPAAAVGQRRSLDGAVERIGWTTTIELRAGEPTVRVTTELDNRARDHRLRAWFPLPQRATTSRAECAYAVVERGLVAEGGPTEVGLPTFPSRRFVQAGGLTVLHDGLLEYELVDLDGDGHDERTTAGALALTLLRCTGMLSRGPMATRPLPAGPLIAMEGSQAQGRHVLRYAVAVGDVDPYALADEVWVPLEIGRVRGPRPADAPTAGAGFEVRGAEVTALHRRGGALTVRVVNPSDEPTTVELPGRRGWLVDLRGRALEPFDGSFPLAPWRIATATLTE